MEYIKNQLAEQVAAQCNQMKTIEKENQALKTEKVFNDLLAGKSVNLSTNANSELYSFLEILTE